MKYTTGHHLQNSPGTSDSLPRAHLSRFRELRAQFRLRLRGREDRQQIGDSMEGSPIKTGDLARPLVCSQKYQSPPEGASWAKFHTQAPLAVAIATMESKRMLFLDSTG